MIEQRPNEAYLAYLARCAEAGEFYPPTTPDPVREVYIGQRFAAVWLPRGFGAFRAYKGSGWRFLQLWRLRVAVKWAYD